LGQPIARDLLLEALLDSTSRIRQLAANGLVETADAATIDRLTDMLRVEDAAARSAALETLPKLGTRATPFIIPLLTDPDGDVRIFAANVLAHIPDPAAVEPLCTALKDSNANVRNAAAEAMGKSGDTRGVEPLLEAIRADE